MILNIRKVLYFGIIWSIILNDHFFHLIDSFLLDIMQIFIIFTLNIISVVYYIQNIRKNYRLKMKFTLVYYLYIAIFIFGGQYWLECMENEHSLTDFLSYVAPYFYIFLLLPLLSFFYLDGRTDSIMKTITIVTVINLLIVLFYAVGYNNSILRDVPNGYKHLISTREGRLRISDLSVFIGISVVYLLKEIFRKRNMIKNVISLIIIIISCFYVQQTRVINYTIIAVCGVMYAYNMKKKSNRVIIYLGILICISVLLLNGEFKVLFGTFSVSGVNGTSSLMRIEEVKYAISRFRDEPVLGYGITNALIPSVIKLKKSVETYSNTDIGIIGSLAMLGITYVGVYIIPMIRYTKLFFRKKKYIKEEYIEICGLLVFLLLTSVTIVVTDGCRIYAWPYYMSILEFFYYKDKIEFENQFLMVRNKT